MKQANGYFWLKEIDFKVGKIPSLLKLETFYDIEENLNVFIALIFRLPTQSRKLKTKEELFYEC